MPPHEHSSWYTPGLLAGIKLLLLMHRMFLMLRPDLKATLYPASLNSFRIFGPIIGAPMVMLLC